MEVLARPKIRSRVSQSDAERFVTALRLLAIHVDDPEVVVPIVTDPRDDYLIALARRESVHSLITGDRAVLAAPAPDLLIETPRQFADRLASS